jgi:N-ethylmaleimide reductase
MRQSLYSPMKIGEIDLKNRIVMAPLTRSRAGTGNVPSEHAAEYYGQRASSGLMITEATQISPQGVGYIRTPGIHTSEQVEGWKKVTKAVHDRGGKIVLQLWHVGRVSHPDFHNGELPVAPSAIGFEGESFTPQGRKKTVVPRALELHEIKQIVKDYENAARLAVSAGFDGVEVHGANGYLLAQFLEDGSNTRSDDYGGTIQNRARLLLEVTDAC